MEDIIMMNEIELRETIFDATNQFFSTMLSMSLPPLEKIEERRHDEAPHFVGCVYFIGDLFSGLLEISLTEPFGQLMAANMLGLSLDDVDSTQDVLDIVQEATNIIGGNLKSKLCDNEFLCKMSPPSVFDSKAYNVNSREWVETNNYKFQYEDHTFFINVYLKPEECKQ